MVAEVLKIVTTSILSLLSYSWPINPTEFMPVLNGTLRPSFKLAYFVRSAMVRDSSIRLWSTTWVVGKLKHDCQNLLLNDRSQHFGHVSSAFWDSAFQPLHSAFQCLAFRPAPIMITLKIILNCSQQTVINNIKILILPGTCWPYQKYQPTNQPSRF